MSPKVPILLTTAIFLQVHLALKQSPGGAQELRRILQRVSDPTNPDYGI